MWIILWPNTLSFLVYDRPYFSLEHSHWHSQGLFMAVGVDAVLVCSVSLIMLTIEIITSSIFMTTLISTFPIQDSGKTTIKKKTWINMSSYRNSYVIMMFHLFDWNYHLFRNHLTDMFYIRWLDMQRCCWPWMNRWWVFVTDIDFEDSVLGATYDFHSNTQHYKNTFVITICWLIGLLTNNDYIVLPPWGRRLYTSTF